MRRNKCSSDDTISENQFSVTTTVDEFVIRTSCDNQCVLLSFQQALNYSGRVKNLSVATMQSIVPRYVAKVEPSRRVILVGFLFEYSLTGSVAWLVIALWIEHRASISFEVNGRIVYLNAQSVAGDASGFQWGMDRMLDGWVLFVITGKFRQWQIERWLRWFGRFCPAHRGGIRMLLHSFANTRHASSTDTQNIISKYMRKLSAFKLEELWIRQNLIDTYRTSALFVYNRLKA